MPTAIRGVPPLEAIAAVCAALNLAFFAIVAADTLEPLRRRAGALAMAFVSLGALLESVLLAAGAMDVPAGVRLPSILGTAVLTALIIRHLAVVR